MKRIVLDTNAYSALLGGDEKVLECLAKAERVALPVFVLGELYFGFLKGKKFNDNVALLEKFLQKPTVTLLNTTQETAEIFGQLMHDLRQAGTPLPLNDVWIAAQAMELGAVLITYDAHFQKVRGLRLWQA